MVTRSPNAKLVGLFVIGAAALFTVALIAFGSGYWWRTKNQFVLYFDESVRGLSVGAPVIFRGVRIGSVGNIRIHLDESGKAVHVPVIIEVEPQEKIDIQGQMLGCADTPQCIAQLVKSGLRAQLRIQSLITAQLMVEFDFFPDTPLTYVDAIDLGIPELPTIPSGLEEITRAVQRIPLDEVINRGMMVLEGVERLINMPQTGESIQNFNATLLQFQQLAGKLETEMAGWGRDLNGTAGDIQGVARFLQTQLPPLAANLQRTLSDVQRLTLHVDQRIEPLESDLADFLGQSRDTMASAEDLFQDAENMIRDDSQFRQSLDQTLRELNGTLRVVRGLAEYLQQYPDALLRGKRAPKGSP
ncbi:MAG: MlaD family protein [Desulfobacterales bacterium]